MEPTASSVMIGLSAYFGNPMTWIQCSKASLEALQDGTVCWVFSRDTKGACAAVFRQGKWHCHHAEHFTVPAVSRYIVLPIK